MPMNTVSSGFRPGAYPASGGIKERARWVNAYLEGCFRSEEIPAALSAAMRYSLLAGGKRLRPALCLACAATCGADPAAALPFAAGIEMIHTYSLIHDDLPAMDNDTLRRGKPTCHVAHGEATAILAGDALLTDSFGFMLSCPLPAGRVAEAAALMSRAAGSGGMVGGQQLDISEDGTVEPAELIVINEKKTGALIRAACECGAVLAGADQERRRALAGYGACIGTAFQITDDILDAVGDSAQTGKNTGRDAENGKVTWPSLIGVEKSRALASDYCARAVSHLGAELFPASPDRDFLISLAEDMACRIS